MRRRKQLQPLKAELFEKWSAEQELNIELVKGESGNGSKFFSVENNGSDQQLLKDEYSKSAMLPGYYSCRKIFTYGEAFMVFADLINIQKTSSKN